MNEELGVEPAKRTQEIDERLLRGEMPVPPTAAVEAHLRRERRTVGPCPYRGLASFQETDAPFFFGRERFIARLVAAVRMPSPVVAVVGPSGSGKSSVVYAGLLPQLRKTGDWLIIDFRPGDQPIHALAAALSRALEPRLDEIDQ